MLKPSSVKTVVTYKCPACNRKSESISIREARKMKSYKCKCGVITKIAPISCSRLVYVNERPNGIVKRQKPEPKPRFNLLDDQIAHAVSIVKRYADNADDLVQKVLKEKDPKTVETLITESIALIADE